MSEDAESIIPIRAVPDTIGQRETKSSVTRKEDIYNHTTETITIVDRSGLRWSVPPTTSQEYSGKILIRRQIEWCTTVKECAINLINRPEEDLCETRLAIRNSFLSETVQQFNRRRVVNISLLVDIKDVINFGGCAYIEEADLLISTKSTTEAAIHPAMDRNVTYDVVPINRREEEKEDLVDSDKHPVISICSSLPKQLVSVCFGGVTLNLTNIHSTEKADGIYTIQPDGEYRRAMTVDNFLIGFALTEEEAIVEFKKQVEKHEAMLENASNDTVKSKVLNQLDTFKITRDNQSQLHRQAMEHKEEEHELKRQIILDDARANQMVSEMKTIVSMAAPATKILTMLIGALGIKT